MEEKIQKNFDLLQQVRQKGLYDLLIGQLQKDFDRANIAVPFSSALSPEQLFARLHENIYRLIMERFSDYLNVLYVVDVPERSFREIPLTDAVEVAAEVSFLILQREWQKVLSKQRYSS
jgi:hypothetical protein